MLEIKIQDDTSKVIEDDLSAVIDKIKATE